jgi:peptidyl-prolyl cis-trans isomerase B (cyclophilin B)
MALSSRSLRRALSVGATLVALTAVAGCGDDADTAADPTSSTSASTSASAGSEESAPAESESPEATGDGPACDYTESGDGVKQVDPPPANATVTGEATGTIETSIGALDITLDGESAPCTVSSFVSLADQGYFDGTTCHRLTTGAGLLVLQCGDPSGTGRGGPGYSFPDELSGEETYGAGTLAMANAGPDTNGSQFFIVYADSQLPPSYTVFGSVDPDSLALVQQAAEAGTDDSNGPGDGAPVTPVDITSVTVES